MGGHCGQGSEGLREVDTVDTESTSRPGLRSAELCGFAGGFGGAGRGLKEKNWRPRQGVRSTIARATAGERPRKEKRIQAGHVREGQLCRFSKCRKA